MGFGQKVMDQPTAKNDCYGIKFQRNGHSSCYDNKGGPLPAHSAKPAIFQYVRVGTDFASFFKGERGKN